MSISCRLQTQLYDTLDVGELDRRAQALVSPLLLSPAELLLSVPPSQIALAALLGAAQQMDATTVEPLQQYKKKRRGSNDAHTHNSSYVIGSSVISLAPLGTLTKFLTYSYSHVYAFSADLLLFQRCTVFLRALESAPVTAKETLKSAVKLLKKCRNPLCDPSSAIYKQHKEKLVRKRLTTICQHLYNLLIICFIHLHTHAFSHTHTVCATGSQAASQVSAGSTAQCRTQRTADGNARRRVARGGVW